MTRQAVRYRRPPAIIAILLLFGSAAGILLSAVTAEEPTAPSERNRASAQLDSPRVAFAKKYCLDCHNSADKTAGLDLEQLSSVNIRENLVAWESVYRKLRTRQMPPPGAVRPEEDGYTSILASLAAEL